MRLAKVALDDRRYEKALESSNDVPRFGPIEQSYEEHNVRHQ